MVKEAKEEASFEESMLKRHARSVGAISFLHRFVLAASIQYRQTFNMENHAEQIGDGFDLRLSKFLSFPSPDNTSALDTNPIGLRTS